MRRLTVQSLLGICGSNLTTPSGVITSPAYPEKYPDGSDCLYLISQADGILINITIFMMDIENSCNYDYLEIRDGISEYSPRLGKFCGNDIPSRPIKSSQNTIWIR